MKGGRFQSAEGLLRQSVRCSIVDKCSSFLKNPSIQNFTDELLTFCLRYLDLDAAFLNSVPLVCKDWHRCANSKLCWSGAENSWSASNGSAVNWANYRFIKSSAHETKAPNLESGAFYTGTEGDCFKAVQRSTGKQLTVKKARVYPGGEGVPYYMLRELSFLEDLRHPHVSRLHRINLKDNHLYCFFDFISCTMYDLINPAKNPTGGKPLSKGVIKMFMHQLIGAIAYCHRRGVVHRNLKPKHLLIKLGPDGDVSKARLQVSDFALVRSTCIPLRTYTTEVVTLWYRPPEVLMGDRYFLPVDMWSIGCIFAEMALGRPFFPGICEIDQLFQIFSTLGTPASDWPEFKSLPNYRFSFPNWKPKDLTKVLPALEPAARSVLSGLLALDPRKRTTAEDALSCSYFDGSNALTSNSPAKGEKLSFPPLRGLRALGLVDGEAGIQPCSSFIDSSRLAYQIGGYDLQFLGNYHAYIRSLESSRFPFRDYLPLQNELRQNHRAMLVDWLIEVVDVFEMSLRSAFLAVQYVDRYLGTTVISRSKFQLLGATCLHIASKCEDVSYIGVDDLAVCADNVYHSKHVLSLEEKVLNSLEFKLSSSTVLDFLNMYLEHCPYFEDGRVAPLSKYLAELSLQEYLVSVSVQPSKVAAACIIRALQCLKKPFWEAWLSAISGYRWSSLRECVTAICDMHARSFNKDNTLLVIRKRYLKSSRLGVANIKPIEYPCVAE
jgi:serine/threonine protein kinase